MGFDLATAKPATSSAPPGGGGFDLASARPAAPSTPERLTAAQLANKAVLEQWRAEGSPQLSTAPKTDAEYKKVSAVMSALNYEKERGRPASELPVATPYRKTTQADYDNEERLRLEGTTPPNRDGLVGRFAGSLEPFAAIGSGLVNTVIGNLYGVGKSVADGKYGSQEGVRDAMKTSQEYVARNTYSPRSDTGKIGTQQIAALAHYAEPLMAVAPLELGMMAGSAASSVRNVRNIAGANAAALGAEEAAQVAGNTGKLMDLVRKPTAPTPGSVGAAATTQATQRVMAADQLPVPMGKLMTKGMRTRDKNDLAFENIAAKDPELGKGLRNRTVEVNQAALENFDALAELTGAQGTGLRPTGKVVDDYLIKRVAGAKSEIRKAYDDAAESVEGKAPADTARLREYLAKHDAEAKSGNAPVINTVRNILDELDPQGTGKIPLKDFNEIRERVGKISKEGSPNAPYRKELQTIVDEAVEANGGPLYRTARRQYENFQNEFKNAGALDRLLRTKPGTKDRAVALEDVVGKTTLDAPSTDAVRQVKTTLTRKQDPEGLQAWKELQGEAARQIKERVTKPSALNEGGAREVSPAALDKIIRELDADNRLEVIFSKQGAQQWRDLRDTVIEMKTVPAGTVSTSGTAEVLAGLLDTAVSGFTGLPLPVASALNYGAKRLKKNVKAKKINRALNPDGEP